MDTPHVAVATHHTVPALGTVLCAVDDSRAASAVLYAAAGLAAGQGSTLVILRVDDDTDVTRVNQLAYATVPGWLAYRQQTDVIVRPGKPAETILSVAAERHVSVIVLGTHSRGHLARMVFGSVTASVLAKTNVPVAVVPPSGPELISLTDREAVPHLGSVLVPVDLKDGCARQLALASKLAHASDREVTLLHAIPRGTSSVEPLRRVRDMSRLITSPTGVKAVVTHGSVVQAIIERQRRAGAGVVVLGRDAKSPGRIASELLERLPAVLVFVP